MLRLATIFALCAAADAGRCACVPGAVPPNVTTSLAGGNNGTVALLSALRRVVQQAAPCHRALWREAFLLCAAWEGSHIALSRHEAAAAQPYFVFPTFCGESSLASASAAAPAPSAVDAADPAFAISQRPRAASTTASTGSRTRCGTP